ISNPLFDNDKINSDEINSHVESNHDTVKFDNLDEFYRPFIPIRILEEERIKREHADYINLMEMLFTINPHPHPSTVDNEDSNEEVVVVDDLLVDNFIQNSEHEYFESEDSDFDNPPVPLQPPEPPDKEFYFEIDFENEISIVRNTIDKFECINVRVKFDVFNDENDVLSYFMFDKVFSLLSAESEDTIFDPEEFTDELARITYPPDYDDNLQFDIESDLKEIEFLLYQGKDFGLKDSIDQTDLANLDDYFVDHIPEMFTDEHASNYSSPLRFDDFSRDDDSPSTNNEDKVFNPGILIYEKPITIITRVAQEKKLAISKASLVFEDFDPPFYEPLFFKDVPKSMMLLPFSSKNEKKVFKLGIYTSKKDS
nr:hypothetical protein [Tanacetum cinerariifolium]